MNAAKEFSSAIIEKLGYYVYLLKDPMTGDVFYIGKGSGNRIFSHIRHAIDLPPDSAKSERIRDIQETGQEVVCLIHRHGLTEKEAFEVEASLIDFVGLPELVNAVAGYESTNRGQMTVSEVMALYDAPKVEILEPSLLIRVNQLYQQGLDADRLYEITRGNWVVGKRREKAKYAFSVFNGIVRQVYRIQRWFPVAARNPSQKTQDRWRFEGTIAAEMRHCIGGSVEAYMAQGNQNPIRYVNC